MCQWLSTRLADHKLMSVLGFILALRHKSDLCSSFRLSRDAFAQPMRSELGTLMDYPVKDIFLRRNMCNMAVWQSLRTPSILKSQGSTAVTSLNRLTSPTTYRPKISYVGAPSYCARTQVSHVRQTDQLSDTACEKVATIKPNDESPLHFDASAATKALATQLVTRLNLTTEQVSSVVSSIPAEVLLTVSAQDFDKRLEALGILMGTTESLANILLEHPNLLLLDVDDDDDDDTQTKVNWLKKIGLTAAEACGLMATYPPLSRVRLNVMQTGGVALLNDELQLASKQMAKIVLGKPSILTSSTEKLESKIRFFSDVLRLSKKDLTTLVLKDPSVLRVSVANLQQKTHFFMEELGMRRLQLTQMIKAYPQVLGLSVENKIRPNVMYMEFEIGIPRGPLKRVLTTSPWLLSHSVDRNMKPKERWITVNLLLRRDQLIKLVIQNPQILSMNVENNLAPKVSWLRDTFGITALEVRDMILRYPPILLSNIDNNIKPKIEFFTEELGFEKSRLLKTLVKIPVLLSYSTQSMLVKVSYLKERLRLEDDDVKSLVGRCPQVLGYAVKSIDAKVDFLRMVLEASHDQARDIVLKYPQVLNLSVEKNLGLKIRFFTDVLQGSLGDVRDVIAGSPAILGYSLANRLKPRVEVLRSIGVEPVFSEHVWLISSYSDLRFSKWAEKFLVESLGAEGRGDESVRRRMKALRVRLQDR